VHHSNAYSGNHGLCPGRVRSDLSFASCAVNGKRGSASPPIPLPGSADLRQAIQHELTREVGTHADAKALAAAAVRVYDTLAGQLALLIGDGGVRALTARSLHLVQREFPWLAEAQEADSSKGPFPQVGFRLERQEPAVATEAAVALLATLGGLLEALIGEALTMRVLRAAWPSAFPDETQQETRNR
jgi:hypothetical protein